MRETDSGGLARINTAAPRLAAADFLRCCGATRWAGAMAAARPFAGVNEMLEAADRIWWGLAAADWLEAFRSHPRIGQAKAAGEWSEQEQAGARDAPGQVLHDLAAANDEYEHRFGYIFIVCATGKSAEEMLAILTERLGHDVADELRMAAAEQVKITRLRLQRLLNPTPDS